MDLMLVMKERFRGQSSELRFLYRSMVGVTATALLTIAILLYLLQSVPSQMKAAPTGVATKSEAKETTVQGSQQQVTKNGGASPWSFHDQSLRTLVVCLLLVVNSLLTAGLFITNRALGLQGTGGLTGAAAAAAAGPGVCPSRSTPYAAGPASSQLARWNLMWVYVMIVVVSLGALLLDWDPMTLSVVILLQLGVYASRVNSLRLALCRVDAAPKSGFW